MKKLGWALIAVLLVVGLITIKIPPLIQYYIEGHYPGLKVLGDIRIHLTGIEVTKLSVDRHNIKGVLDEVFVDRSKNVHVTSGHIEVTLEDNPKDSSRDVSITGENLEMLVHKGATTIAAHALNFDSRQVCFDSGDILYQGLKVRVGKTRIDRTTKQIRSDSASVAISLPFEVPKMGSSQELALTSLEADPEAKILLFQGAQFGTFLTIKGRSTVKVTDDDVFLDLASVTVNHPWISLIPVIFPDMGLVVPKSVVKTKSGSIRITSGPASIRIDPSTYHLEGDEECNAWIKAMPDPVPDALKKALGHFSGRLSFEVKTLPAPFLNIKNSCKFECRSDLITSLKSGRFEYKAYDKSNNLFTRTLGPFGKDWVPLMALPPSISKAFITLEDPGFSNHRGIIPQALENSLKANLKLGKFFRGGSTISMQLAKNIWLQRSKTLGRKAQEALLTIALESCLTKAEILEYYLNAVEFGPDLYGIGPAAQHYFKKPAAALEPDEAFYLASLLPHPRTALPPTPSVMAGVRKLMGVLAEHGYISDQLIPLPDSQVNSAGWDTE